MNDPNIFRQLTQERAINPPQINAQPRTHPSPYPRTPQTPDGALKPERFSSTAINACCATTLETNLTTRNTNPPPGAILTCEHCTAALTYHDYPMYGVWQWHPPQPENEHR